MGLGFLLGAEIRNQTTTENMELKPKIGRDDILPCIKARLAGKTHVSMGIQRNKDPNLSHHESCAMNIHRNVIPDLSRYRTDQKRLLTYIYKLLFHSNILFYPIPYYTIYYFIYII